MSEFENKVALVTGGAMGIGEAVARLLAKRGPKVAIVDRANEKATEVAASMAAEGGVAKAVHADVSLAQDAERAVTETLTAFGRLDIDFAPDGVRVNCVAPGTVDTPMRHWAVSLDEQPERLMAAVNSMHPLGRIATPQEVAEVVALSSPRASFVTGATYLVDGGLLLLISDVPKTEETT